MTQKSWDAFLRFIEGRARHNPHAYTPGPAEQKPAPEVFKQNGKWYLTSCYEHRRPLTFKEFMIQHCFWCEPEYAPPGDICYNNKENRHYTKEEMIEKLAESRKRKNKNAED